MKQQFFSGMHCVLFRTFKNILAISTRSNQFANNFKRHPNVYNYKSLFPWQSISSLADFLFSSAVYNKGGLIALNKPFGIKIYSHDSIGSYSKVKQRSAIPTIPDCNFTIEDTLEDLKILFKVPELTVLKSTERYSSGVVLLSTNNATSAAVKKSFNLAKANKQLHLVHWIVTLGYPVMNYRKEKVGIKFLEEENLKHPTIVTEVSKRASKLKMLHPVNVEYRVLSQNNNLPSSLVEIACSSVKHYFVRVYASSRITSIMGDLLYSNRMNTLLGVPVNVQVQQAAAFDLPPLSADMARALEVPKGVKGHSTIPTLLHLKSIFLPSFQGEDVTVTAPLPEHFQWTAERLNLLPKEYK